MIAAAYIRVSTEKQDEYSLDSQLKLARECAKRDGYVIPDEYVFCDDGISGKSVKKRNGFNHMIALAKEKDRPFDVIYVWKFSRFARDMEASIVYKSLLQKKGVTVKSVSETIPEGPFGSLVERIIEWMDQFYLINLASEVRRGMTEKVSRGEPTCAPPMGYSMREGRYYPDENADIVREVFTRFSEGEKQRAIAIDLGSRGIRTRYGNPPDNRFVDYMLHNPCYIGKLRWSKEGERFSNTRTYEDATIIDGLHEPIVSAELWDKVQIRLAEQKKAYPKYARREQPIGYVLKGLVRCSACGATLTASSVTNKEGNKYMQCHAYAKGSCHVSHCVNEDKLLRALILALKEAVGNQTFTISPPLKKTSSAKDYARLIQAEEKKLERARQAYLAEVDTIEQYAANKKEIQQRIEALKREHSEAPPKVDTRAYTKRVVGVIDFLESSAPPQDKNEMLRTIIEKMVYTKSSEHLDIFFRI